MFVAKGLKVERRNICCVSVLCLQALFSVLCFEFSVTVLKYWLFFNKNAYVSLCLCVQNAVPAQPCVGKLEISLVLLNFLHCNFR